MAKDKTPKKNGNRNPFQRLFAKFSAGSSSHKRAAVAVPRPTDSVQGDASGSHGKEVSVQSARQSTEENASQPRPEVVPPPTTSVQDDASGSHGKEVHVQSARQSMEDNASQPRPEVVPPPTASVQDDASVSRDEEVVIQAARQPMQGNELHLGPDAPAEANLWDEAWEKVKEGEYGKYVARYERIILRDKYPRDGAHKETLQPLASADRAKRMQAVLDEQAEKLRQARWGFLMSGRKIEVADMVEKIVDGVLYVKDFVGRVIKETGEPHAALAWAGVCLLLPLVMNSTIQRKAAVALLDRIADLAARYRVREEVFLAQPSGSNDSQAVQELRASFRQKTIALYREILVAQILLACAYARSGFLQYGRDIVKYDDWESSQQSLHKTDKQITTMVSDLAHGLDFRLAQSMWLEQRKWIESQGESQAQLQKEQENRACLQTLSSVLDYETCKNQVAARIPGTLRWFFEEVELFKSWRNSRESQTLIVYAGAGCGKSVMMRAAVDEEISSNTERITCYFFFRQGPPLQESVSEALNALLHQIVSQAPHLVHLVVPDYQKYGSNLSAKVEVLWRIICQCSSAYEGEIICILDGLDECATTNNIGRVGEERAFVPRMFLVKRLQSLWNKDEASTRPTTGRLKFLITIQSNFKVGFDQQIMRTAASNQVCELSKEWIVPRTDVAAFVEYKVERLMQKEYVKQQLKQQLMKKQGSSTTFLWLSLIIEVINTEAELQDQSTENLTKFLSGDFPDTIDGAFEALLPAVKYRQKARAVFNIMLAARTPLTVPQLNQALKFAMDGYVRPGSGLALQSDAAFEVTLSSYCGALICILPSGNDRLVTFFHSTARDFLLPHPINDDASSHAEGSGSKKKTVQDTMSLRHNLDLAEANAVLRKCCTSFLKWRGTADVADLVLSQGELRSKGQGRFNYSFLMQYLSGFTVNQPFMAYAAVNWINHLPFDTLDAQIRNDVDAEISQLCDVSSPVFQTWFLCCWLLWWPESDLGEFFGQYIAGWVVDHVYPDRDVIERFGLDVFDIEDNGKWWKWTASGPLEEWEAILEICKPPRDDRRGVNFIPFYATRLWEDF